MSITFKQHTLANGLTVIAECSPEAHTAAVGFFVKTGARDETLDVMGVSHFLEHMMFKGTARRSADDVNREFDEIGANYNAYTSHENTVYYAQVLPEFLPRAVDLLGDMLRPSLRQDDFDMEKKVILEEIGMYDDRPEWVLQDRLLEEYFLPHTLGFRVLGTTDIISSLTSDQMRTYFEHRYSPDNIVVTAAGRVDFDALVADIEKLCGSWKPTGAKRVYDAPAPVDKQLTVEDAKVNRHYMAMLCPGPATQSDQRYAAKVLGDVLGDSDGSRLYWELVDPGLADEAEFSFMPQDQAGNYMAYASCDPARGEEVESKLLGVLDAFASGKTPITEAELDRAKNKIATQATVQGEKPMGRMQALGGQWQYLGEYTPLDEEIRKMMAVTLEDVQATLAAYAFQPRTLLRLTPEG